HNVVRDNAVRAMTWSTRRMQAGPARCDDEAALIDRARADPFVVSSGLVFMSPPRLRRRLLGGDAVPDLVGLLVAPVDLPLGEDHVRGVAHLDPEADLVVARVLDEEPAGGGVDHPVAQDGQVLEVDVALLEI